MAETVDAAMALRVAVTGEVTDDEAAAISAAIQLLWPEDSRTKPEPVVSSWRYSGRRWGGPKPAWRLSNRI